MPRPRKFRRIRYNPDVYYFKPQGVPMHELEEINLELDELEALRLKYKEELDQKASAEKMGISQSTLQRILAKALEKISLAILEGKAIKIELNHKKVENENN